MPADHTGGFEDFSPDLAPVSDAASPKLDGGTVLLVEDNVDMLAYVGQLLSGRFQVTTTPNGRIALEMALKTPPELARS